MQSVEEKFLFEVARFRLWTATAVKQTGEWQSEYPEWESVYEATEAFLVAVDVKAESKAIVDELLYILDADNEMWAIADVIAKHPSVLNYLAQAAIDSDYFWAKSQLAEMLVASTVHRSEVERILFALANDENEYTRCRALGALAKINSPLINELIEPAWARNQPSEQWAVLFALHKTSLPEFERYLALAQNELIEPAWASNHQYQRLMVLSALYKISSPELEKYLALADADGREYLVAWAARVRCGEID